MYNMRDYSSVFAVAVLLIVFALYLSYFFGGSIEKDRSYNKCLNENSSMVYSDAVAKCKEVVKR